MHMAYSCMLGDFVDALDRRLAEMQCALRRVIGPVPAYSVFLPPNDGDCLLHNQNVRVTES